MTQGLYVKGDRNGGQEGGLMVIQYGGSSLLNRVLEPLTPLGGRLNFRMWEQTQCE